MPDLDTMRRAAELLERGRYEEAIAEYKAVLETSRKKNPALLNLIGDIHAKQASFERAFDAYADAARLYAEEGLFHNGIAVGKKILRMDREQIEVYGMLGNLYARQGLGGDCVKFLREFARRKDEVGEYPGALAAFAEACEILKQFPEVHAEYGEMLEKVDRNEDAAACYQNVARIWADRGVADRSKEWSKRAAALTGESVQDSSANMSEIMSLRTLDDTPPSSVLPTGTTESRDQFWGRKDLPEGLQLDTPSSSSTEIPNPWLPFNPKKHPGLPPPPPLPARSRRAPDAPPVTLAPAAAPSELFLEPAGLSTSPPATSEPPLTPVGRMPRDLELTLDGLSAAPESAPPVASVPAFAPPPPVEPPAPIAPPIPARPTIAGPPAEGIDAELAAFFESTTSEPDQTQQAVIIGDDLGLMEGGDVSEVIADFRAATAEILDLDDHQAHYDLGTTYMEMELFEEAAAEFEIAARGKEFALPSQEMLGYCFLRKGHIDLAIRELEKGLAIPGTSDHSKLGLLYNLGIACSVLDRDEDAIQHFRRILGVDPDFRDTQTRLERLTQSA